MNNKMLQQMCRTCLATCGELVPIFSSNYYVHNLPDKLLHTTRIEVSRDDSLPKMMCKKCIFLVDSLYCFKDQCEMAEIKLKKSLGTNDLNTSFNNLSCDQYILGKAEDHSDAITSSEEEYQVEYVSEEARREVENARRRSRNAKHNNKRKRIKPSRVKVQSVEILPNESKDNVNRNLKIQSSYKLDTPEFVENIIISDSDDKTSTYVPERLKFSCKTLDRKSLHESGASTSEKIQFFKQKYLEKSPIKNALKRKGVDESFNSLSKVPKKVMFKDNDYDDENMQFIEVTDNVTNRVNDSTLKEMKGDVEVVQINAVADNIPLNNDETKIKEQRMQNLIKHVVLNVPKICSICPESFNSSVEVLKHKMNVHLNTNRHVFSCPICYEKFYSNDNLLDHLNVHENIQSFVCTLCSNSFYTDSTLRMHLASHADVHDLRCLLCSKKYVKFHNLLIHLDQHISENQIVCTFCSDKFCKKSLFEQHINLKHMKVEPVKKPITQVSEAEERMEDNRKNTNVFPCPYCEENFATKTVLRDHVFTHLGVQQYSCLVCEKTFASQDERTQHVQEHMKPQLTSDNKKFRCRVCHKILISRIAYGQHLKDNHWNAKQTNEILRELSDTLNEKVNEQFSKSCNTPPASDSVSST